MNTDIGHMLREGIDRLEVPAGTGAGLTERARRRHRARRVAVRAGATAAAAVAVGTAVTVMVTLGAGNRAPGTGHTTVRTVAYVARQMRAALARTNLIQQVGVSGQGALHTIEPTISTQRLIRHIRCTGWSHPSRHKLARCLSRQPGPPELLVLPDDSLPQSARAVGWSYRGRLREEGLMADGKLVFDASSVAGPPGQIRVQGADYVHKTWWRGVVRHKLQAALGGGPPADVFPLDGWTSASWPIRIRELLSYPAYRIVGRQRIGGVDAIKIRAVYPWHGSAVFTQWREILWVGPSSYLPLRDEWIWLGRRGPVGSIVANYRWLAPTPARLAALRTAVPRGFRAAHGGTLIPGSVFIFWANHWT